MVPDDLTSDWFSTVFDIDVQVATMKRIGDGLVGLNLRVVLVHDGGAPDSVVVKLPSLDETSKATGIALRNYEREVKFYEHIADTVDIRVPVCHHGQWHEDTGDFVLVLEDMAPAEQGDQITGCSGERASDAVRALADLHGPRWGDESLHEHEFLQRRDGDRSAIELTGIWNMVLPGFLATYADRLDEPSLALVEEFGRHVGPWVAEREGAWTVTHGDYRLDNLLFATPEGGPTVTAVDWQTPGHGVPIADLSYFCGAGLLTDDRRHLERELVTTYVDRLAGHGVSVEWDWVWEQYVRDAFAGVVMAVAASQLVGGSERSVEMFGAMATRHLQHALDLDALDLVR
ncbi:MAG: phosphotransferase family protein [Ilumatobacter sp.]